MSSEKFANNPQTTLNGSITSGAASLVVTSASAFPSAGQFRLIIDTEILLVTAVSGTTFTISRAQESTTAASHANGATATMIVTKGALDQRTADECQEDVLANLPSAEKAGRLYFNDDDVVVQRDTGGAWNNFGPLFRLKTPPAAGSWTAFNSAPGLVQMNSGLYLAGRLGAGANLSGYTMSAPAAPYTIDMAFLTAVPMLGYASVGFCWSDGTKYVTAMYGVDEPDVSSGSIHIPLAWIQIAKYSNPTTVAGTYNFLNSHGQMSLLGYIAGGVWWLQAYDDNTNLGINLSADGQHWFNVFSAARTNYLSSPSKVGICTDPATNNAINFGSNLIHWYQH